MRELKFRCWNVRNKRFLEKVPTLNLTLGHFEVSGYEWSQFTGLTDRLGKEIYEGDIVKIIDKDIPRTMENWQIIFEEGKFIPYCFGTSLSDINNDCEVIGNIFEHPDLLKG